MRNAPSSPSLPRRTNRAAFSLIELLVVVGVSAFLMSIAGMAINGLKNAQDTTDAAMTIAGALNEARAHAIARGTYVWVGMQKDDTAPAGEGRLLLFTVASKDGTSIYDPSRPAALASDKLYPVKKLTRIRQAALESFANGTGDGDTFDTRAPAEKFDPNLPASATTFDYPLDGPRKYTFERAIEFNPRGEARIYNSGNALKPVIELGVRPAHDAVADAQSRNLIAIQISGIAGRVTVFRK